MCSFILKKLTKMSATIYFNTASHIWCCDEHHVLEKKVLHQQPCLGHSNDSLQMVGSTWFPVFEYICHIFTDIQKSFHVILVWLVLLTQLLPQPQVIFPSKTWFLGIYLTFQRQKSFKNQNLSHSESKSHQINSIKSCSSRSFQQHPRHIPIPQKFSATT